MSKADFSLWEVSFFIVHGSHCCSPCGAFSVSSVQLVARRIKPQCVIYDFMCSVTRMIFLTSIFIRATSCTLRGVISCVACILMHDQTTQGTLFKPFGIHDFVRSVPRMIFLTSIFIRATSFTLRGRDFIL